MQQSPCSPTTCCGPLVPPEWPVALARLSEKSRVCRLSSPPPLNAPKSAVLLPDSTGAPHEDASPRQCGKHTILLTRVLASPGLGCHCPFPATQPQAPEDPAMSPTELPSGLRPCQKLTLLASPPTRGAESCQQWFSIQSTKSRLL